MKALLLLALAFIGAALLAVLLRGTLAAGAALRAGQFGDIGPASGPGTS